MNNQLLITTYIDDFLAKKLVEADQYDQLNGELISVIKELIHRGGKRMRPNLALLTYEAFGGQKRQAFMPVAASQELFHAFLLMHDDIIDRDTIRWGGPNVSGHYRRSLAGSMTDRQAVHLADASALIAGDLCHAFADEMIITSAFNPKILLKCATLLQKTLFETMAGETVDMHLSTLPLGSVSRERIMTVTTHKTARYSFSTPLALGALCAGAGPNELQLLEEFGQELGVAYQLRDDVLGIYGDEAILGKSVLSDMQEGKQTLLTYYAYRAADSTQKNQLTKILGDPNSSDNELALFQTILTDTKAVVKTELEIKRWSDKALASFEAVKAASKSLRTSLVVNELEAMIATTIDRVR